VLDVPLGSTLNDRGRTCNGFLLDVVVLVVVLEVGVSGVVV